MKKILSLILTVLVILSCTACDGVGKATVTFADNSTEKTSLTKLVNLHKNNDAGFYEKYPEGTVITFIDKIDNFINDTTFTVDSGITVKLKSGSVESLYSWDDKDDVVEIAAEITRSYSGSIEVSANSITLII